MRTSKIDFMLEKKQKVNLVPEQFHSFFYAVYNYYQEQPLRDVFRNRCS